jgi:hypothetical protein
MVVMRKPLVFALLLALPLEAASFLILPFPLDVGLPNDADWFVKLMSIRWVAMHWIGLQMGRWFDGHDLFMAWAIVFGGYLEIAAVLYITAWVLRALRRSAESPVITSRES